MDAVVLDTDVFSFFFRQDSRRDLYLSDLRGRQWCLAFQSVAELLRWSMERNWGVPRRRLLDQAMRQCIVLPYDAGMAEQWAAIMTHGRKSGGIISNGDAWIAAAARRYDLPLATHNGAHFHNIPSLRLICHAPDFRQ